MTKTEQDIFFALLRSAIWEKPVEMEYIKGKEYSWLNILQAFADHAILGVVANAVMHLPEEYLPEDELQQEILQYASDTKKLNEEFDIAVVESFELLQKNGLHPVLLKGQGLSALYPKSCYRSCGDIDIYIGEKDCEKAYRLIEDYCQSPRRSEIYKKGEPHCEPIHKGIISFELHHHACDAVMPSDSDKMNEYYATLLKSGENSCINIKGHSIPIFSPDANAIYVFNHFLEHLFYKGCGFRQIIDLLLLLKADPCTSELKNILNDYHLYKSWQIIGGILVHQLGFDSSMFPFYEEHLAAKSQGILLTHISGLGNFGSFSDYSHRKLPYGLKRVLFSIVKEYNENRALFILIPSLAVKRESRWLYKQILRFFIKKVVLLNI